MPLTISTNSDRQSIEEQQADADINLSSAEVPQFGSQADSELAQQLLPNDSSTFSEMLSRGDVSNIYPEDVAAHGQERLMKRMRFRAEVNRAQFDQAFEEWSQQYLERQNLVSREQAPEAYALIEEMVNELDPDGNSLKHIEIHVASNIEQSAVIAGRHIVITTGMLELLNESPNALRFVIAHEIAHNLLEHYVTDQGPIVMNGMDDRTRALHELTDTYVIRRSEADADNLALSLLERAGYSAQGGLDFFKMIGSQTEQDIEAVMEKTGLNYKEARVFLEISNTHPMNERRISSIRGALYRQEKEELELN